MANKKVANNIFNLRTAHGESQGELGKAINVSKSTISNYELEVREPDIEKLQAIAEHYGFPVDRLIEDDFSEMNFQLSSLTWERMMEVLEVMLPLLSNEKALENEHFRKGYQYSVDIWKAITGNKESIMRFYFERALEEYQDAFVEGGVIEAVANMVWITLVSYALMPDEHAVKVGEAILYGKALKKDFVKKYVLKDSNPISKENADNKKEYAKESYENRMVLLKILKESETYSDLAHYYSALQYVVGFVDNEYGLDLNKTIGMEMMTTLVELGNQYAYNFIKANVSL